VQENLTFSARIGTQSSGRISSVSEMKLSLDNILSASIDQQPLILNVPAIRLLQVRQGIQDSGAIDTRQIII